eukprot:GHUV01033108.1.p1 GENE.GHUV01033108.1~~GHUV01033108.1.p1  ORF type:complete len:141 (+),score=41.25 GHUV01033108.1:396-818(+)
MEKDAEHMQHKKRMSYMHLAHRMEYLYSVLNYAPTKHDTLSTLLALQEELVYQLQHTAGLNPKAFQARYCRAGPAYGASYNIMRALPPDQNSMLQGDLILAYAGMDMRAQTAIAEAVGLEPNPDVLLQDLRDLTIATDFL